MKLHLNFARVGVGGRAARGAGGTFQRARVGARRRPHETAAFGERGRHPRHVRQVGGSIECGQVVAGCALRAHPVALRPARRVPGFEFLALLHRHQSQRVGFGAELARRLRVLHLEHRLARLDERLQQAALGVLDAFLVDRIVVERLEFGDLLGVALQSDRQTERVRRVRQPLVVGQLLGRRDREARAVLPPVDVVGLDAVESLFLAQLETGFHERLDDRQLTDVKPFLFGPSRVGFAENGSRELARVRTPSLPGAGVHVADDVTALCMQRGHDRGFVFEQVDVIHRRVDGLIDRHAQLPLPRRVDGRSPVAGGPRALGVHNADSASRHGSRTPSHDAVRRNRVEKDCIN